MAKTDKYRQQHQELVALVGEIVPLLEAGKLAQDGGPARHALSQLAAKLKVHLAMEDTVLYPELMAHKDPAVVAKAKAFATEMGGIKEAFGAYMAKYGSESLIQASAAQFVKDTQGLFGVLAKRIEAENTVLYPLADG